jgi:hypothetical protein
MAIAFDAATDGGIVLPGTSLTWSHTCSGSDRLLRVGLRTVAGASLITGVTYNGDAMTLIDVVAGGGARRAVELWELLNPDSGAHDVIASASGSDVIMGESVSYTGVGAAYDDSNTAVSDSSSPAATVTVTPVANNAWVQGVHGNNTSDPSSGTNTTERVSSANGIGLYDNNAAISPAAATTLAATTTAAADVVWVAASIVPVAAATGHPWHYYAQQ